MPADILFGNDVQGGMEGPAEYNTKCLCLKCPRASKVQCLLNVL